jgi:transposase InsO family protein
MCSRAVLARRWTSANQVHPRTDAVTEARVRLGAFRRHYNTERPHSQLGYLSPLAFKSAWLEARAKQQDP